MTREEAAKILSNGMLTTTEKLWCEAFEMAIKALSQEPTDRIEYGTDGNAYKLWVSNGKEFEQEPCDKCQYKRTSICGNCKEYDEFEEIDFVQEHKKIPVTLDLTPCTDAVSREDVMQILYDYDCTNENALMVKAIKALPSVTPTCEEREKGECPWYAG